MIRIQRKMPRTLALTSLGRTRRRLLAMRLELAGTLRPPAAPEAVADDADLAEATQEQELAGGVSDLVARSLADIDRALARIEDGTYGICEACGLRIAVSRLRALPSASLCVRCKAQQEAAEADQPEPLARWEAAETFHRLYAADDMTSG